MAENPRTPPGPDNTQGEDTQNAGYKRLWEDPIGVGDTIPFDPAKHAPPLTPEQLKELLKDDKD